MSEVADISSGLKLRAAAPQDRDELAEFLGRILGYPQGTFFIRPEVLDWKYFQPRSDWNGPRNWIISSRGSIVAHLGSWPFRINTTGGPVDGLHPIDWAADPEFAGVGALLFRNMMRRVPVMLALGGTKDAQRVLPGLGFSAIGDADVYARSVRPWNVLRETRPSSRGMVRIARNALRSFGVQAASRGWSADAVDAFSDADLEPVMGILDSRVAFLDTSTRKLNFVLACPGGNGRGFTLSRGGKRVGYLVLSRPDGQARITDLRICSLDPGDWASAYSLALDLAKQDRGCNEIMSFASTELMRGALAANGFRRVGSRVIRLIDRRNILKDLPPLQLQSITTDAFFVSVPSRPYYLV
jgi:hypothetical protein